MYIISSCLMGENCKYNGGNNYTKWVAEFAENKNIITICPEELGGLETPRPASEQLGEKVISKTGTDVTEEFKLGAEQGYEILCEVSKLTGETLDGAILKANSPSCGSEKVYDGTFSGTLIAGNGYFTAKLKRAGIPVITEADEARVNEIIKEKSHEKL